VKFSDNCYSWKRRGDHIWFLIGEVCGKQPFILNVAGRLNITYYDAAYLIEAQRLNKTLVIDDEKLTKAAKSVGVKTLTSRTLRH